ncbi:MAG TPA: hypothetical protein VFN61_02255, partial [Acidimicrobiales bacterium]|nr:hypothetical protein [Acidimicrobiales bacterium]
PVATPAPVPTTVARTPMGIGLDPATPSPQHLVATVDQTYTVHLRWTDAPGCPYWALFRAQQGQSYPAAVLVATGQGPGGATDKPQPDMQYTYYVVDTPRPDPASDSSPATATVIDRPGT